MRDILTELDRWRASGERIALATVVETWGSAPRPVGAKMAITLDGKIAGSVSGGCVEGAVRETGIQVLRTGEPRLLNFGVTNEKAWEVGLACGGRISVFVEPLDLELFEPIRRAIDSRRRSIVATVVRGPEALLGRKLLLDEEGTPRSTMPESPANDAASAARTALAEGTSGLAPFALHGPEPGQLFLEVVTPSPTLVIVGGVHITVTLTTLARALGYRTVIVDPREVFANPTRFPHADALVTAWPDAGLRQVGLDSETAVAVLTHDPKLDDPALIEALPSKAFYVGALGSSRTQEKRRQRLREAGVTEEQLARLHGPIGLELHGRSPEEIALSVMAEIVAVRNQGGGARSE
ncbi:MAG TPA: XdhC/CoxI family protein [Thermoanaerobaculia bacterium]